MRAISASSRFAEPRRPDTRAIPIIDVTECVKSWGRTGITLGAIVGFVLGAVFVAIPLSTDVLTFGVLGTLLVGTVECAAVAGAFAAFAAALYGNGVRGGNAATFERILKTGRLSTLAGARDVPIAEWPARWAYPLQTSGVSRMSVAEPLNTAFPLPDVQARLNTIDAWELGNTGP